jgi:hypothetical protein
MPFDLSDPTQLNSILGGGFVDPNAPPQSSQLPPGMTAIPGFGMVPSQYVTAQPSPGMPPGAGAPGANGAPVPGMAPMPQPTNDNGTAPPSAPVQNEPDQVAATVGTPADRAKQAAVDAKKAKAQAAYASSMQGQTDAAQSMIQGGYGMQAKARQMLADAQGQQGDQEAAAYGEGNRQADALRAQQQEQLKRDMADQQRTRDQLQQVTDQYANSKVDQNRYFHDMGTGQTVMMGIGLALSSIGQAMNYRQGDRNAPNIALDMVMNAAKQDVQLQMADREKLGQLVGFRGQALDRAMSITRDNQATYNTMLAGTLDRVAQQVKEIAAQSQSSIAKANATDFIGQLQTLSGQALDAATQQSFQRQQAQRNTAIAAGHLGLAEQQFNAAQKQQDRENKRQDIGDAQAILDHATQVALALRQKPGADAKTVKEAAEARTAQAGADAAERANTPMSIPAGATLAKGGDSPTFTTKGKPYTPVDSTTRTAIEEKTANTTEAIGAIDKLRAYRQENGAQWTNNTDAKKMVQEAARATIALSKADGIKRLGGDQLEILNGVLGTDDPSAHQLASVVDLLDNAREDAVSSYNSFLDSKGIDPVKFDPPGDAGAAKDEMQKNLDAAQEMAPKGPVNADTSDEDSDYYGHSEWLPAIRSGVAAGERRVPSADAFRGADNLIIAAKRGDQKAIANLQELANNGSTTAIRHYVREAIYTGRIPVDPDQSGWLWAYQKLGGK